MMACVALLGACAEQFEAPKIAGRDVRLTILHTSDIHSRLLPYDFQPLRGDQELGLDPTKGPFGGIARIAHVIERERKAAPRSIYVDSGDCFQGAPIFNAFLGEVEQRAMTQLRPDAVVIGNHEFDEGIRNYVKQLQRWGGYPVIAANYLFEPGEPLGDIARPVEIINADGLKIAIIGIANFSSLSSITDIGNSLHVIPIDIHQSIQEWIDVVRPHVDLIVGVSHAGLGEDEELIRATTGLDIIMGGHLHIVLNPPKVIPDRSGRDVILAHSGAFAKFVGKLDVVVRDGEVIAHDYEVFAIDSDIPEEPTMVDLVEPYQLKLHQLIDLESVYGYSAKVISRFDFDGGDSPLGNLVAEGVRQYARADFGMTNSLGIRTDLNPGAVTLDQLYNIFPFNNYVTTMYLSGADVQTLLDYVTLRSAGRGCATQVQVSGIEFVMDCAADPPGARDIVLTDCGDPSLIDKTGCDRVPLQPDQVYEMATNDYIAGGGSGFTILKINNTQVVTDVALRDAVLETVIRSPLCVEECRQSDGDLQLEGCIGYEDCVSELTDFYAKRCTDASAAIAPTVAACDACSERADCYPCAAGGSCAPCGSDADCDGGWACVEAFCRPAGLTCAAGRCYKDCDRGACTGAQDKLYCNGVVLETCGSQAAGSCRASADCFATDGCTPETCTVCASKSECGPNQVCVGGFCRSAAFSCVGGRCQRTCATDAECPNATAASAAGMTLCVDGACVPRAGQPCDDTAGCLDPDVVCAGGACPTCEANTDCSDGKLCIGGSCMEPVATCVSRRCRLSCSTNAECAPGEACNALGHCETASCLTADDPESQCRELAQWRSLERCLAVPCPVAESDGRISRILPANLEDLPTDISPDDPE